MDVLWSDLRLAMRALSKNWLVTVPAVLSLALGIGANTTIFTFLHAVFANPLPVEEPSRLMRVFSTRLDEPGSLPLSYDNFIDYREKNRVFSALAATRWVSVDVELGDNSPLRLFGELVTGNYFETLGVETAAGQVFREADEATGEPIVVLSHSFWQRHLGGDPDIIGDAININDLSFTVVGIAEQRFRGLVLLRSPDFWVPLWMRQQILLDGTLEAFEKRDRHLLATIGRLAPGVDEDRAEAGLEVLTRNLARSFPEANRGLGVGVEPLLETTMPNRLRGNLTLSGGLMMLVVGVLLVIAGANVANLLLARAFARRRETAVRLALGAGQGQLVRQLLAEGMLLAILGGAAGLVVAAVGRELLWGLRPFYLPESLDLSFNPYVLGFAFGLSLVVGVVFSLIPASQSRDLDLASELKDRADAGGGAGGRARNLLVVLQVALSMVVLVGAGLFLASLKNLENVDPGFATEDVFLVPIAIGAQGYSEPEGQSFYQRLAERIQGLPGVEGAALSSRPLLAAGGQSVGIESDDLAVDERAAGATVRFNVVSPGYFKALDIRLLEGRDFTPADREGSVYVAVVNRAMADWLWPDGSAVGQRIRFDAGDDPIEIVGVVESALHGNLRQEPEPYFYAPVGQNYFPSMILHVRASASPDEVSNLVRQEVHALEPKLPLLETRFVEQLMENSLWAARMIAGLLSFFGALALLLSMVGIYGVMAYDVRLRSREVGIRIAMGAGKKEVLVHILGRGLRLVGLGIAAGLVISLAGSRFIASLLYGVAAFDPVVLGATALVLATVAVLALAQPARRATRVDPMLVLREE